MAGGGEYLRRILTARVYDVAIESPLELAPGLSERRLETGSLKREDLQPIKSFKLRGAYNKMAAVARSAKARGDRSVGGQSCARRRACRAETRMSRADRDAGDDAEVKVDAVRARCREVVLFGDSYSDASHAHVLSCNANTS